MSPRAKRIKTIFSEGGFLLLTCGCFCGTLSCFLTKYLPESAVADLGVLMRNVLLVIVVFFVGCRTYMHEGRGKPVVPYSYTIAGTKKSPSRTYTPAVNVQTRKFLTSHGQVFMCTWTSQQNDFNWWLAECLSEQTPGKIIGHPVSKDGQEDKMVHLYHLSSGMRAACWLFPVCDLQELRTNDEFCVDYSTCRLLSP